MDILVSSSGLVSLDFNSRYVKTTNDTTGDIDIGSKILVQVPHSQNMKARVRQRIKESSDLKWLQEKLQMNTNNWSITKTQNLGAQHAAGDNSQLVQQISGTDQQVLSQHLT